MADIAVIAAAVAGVRHATEIVRLLRESSTSLEQAEQRLKLADLTGILADTRMQLAEIQNTILEKDQKIKELEEAFQSKNFSAKFKDAYYEVDQEGKAMGEPYCMYCWESNHKKYHLYNQHGTVKTCPHCRTSYLARNILPQSQ